MTPTSGLPGSRVSVSWRCSGQDTSYVQLMYIPRSLSACRPICPQYTWPPHNVQWSICCRAALSIFCSPADCYGGIPLQSGSAEIWSPVDAAGWSRTWDAGIRIITSKTFINPLTALKLFNWNFHSLEVVSRWRDPQLQVNENYLDLTKWRLTIFKFCSLMSRFMFTMFKNW